MFFVKKKNCGWEKKFTVVLIIFLLFFILKYIGLLKLNKLLH